MNERSYDAEAAATMKAKLTLGEVLHCDDRRHRRRGGSKNNKTNRRTTPVRTLTDNDLHVYSKRVCPISHEFKCVMLYYSVRGRTNASS